MKRTTFLCLLGFGGILSLSAQSLDRFVIGSTGHFGTNATNQIEYTVGELMVTTVSGGNIILNQGFHQTNPPYNTSLLDQAVVTLQVYPNPTPDEAVVAVTTSQATAIRLELWDLQGRRLQVRADAQARAGTREFRIQLREQPSGVYFLRLLDQEGHFLSAQRLEKR